MVVWQRQTLCHLALSQEVGFPQGPNRAQMGPSGEIARMVHLTQPMPIDRRDIGFFLGSPLNGFLVAKKLGSRIFEFGMTQAQAFSGQMDGTSGTRMARKTQNREALLALAGKRS